MGTLAVGAVLTAVLGLAIRSMIRDKKKGHSIQCGMECKHCNRCCGGR
ncbi:MAG: FeoB-associated Cys-rich membrane protein [Lachnospiraceae bacterium]|nr:FeoB-associated Cys-rich membrane protein [Lachnospiraceae bacterium]MCX4315713.1 FeoB-associated Cys-rich membrane protein [Lachnospiraceae bacterium]